LRAAYGTPEFQAEYLAAINGEPLPGVAPRVLATSLQWLWDSYRETGAWTELAASTRKQRENIMLHILKDSGAKPYAAIGKANIVAGLDRRSKTPAAARNFLDTMRGMFEWAAERKHVKADPTVGVKGPKRKKGKGFPAWTREDIETYRKKWPLGTRQRVWLDVLLYTGPRRGDAAVIGKQHERTIKNPDGSVSRSRNSRPKRAANLSRSQSQFWRRYSELSRSGPPETLLGFAAPAAGRSPRRVSATSFRRPPGRPGL
jgi:site-specific recombinase XerD